jgi:anti-anti-sigma factor
MVRLAMEWKMTALSPPGTGLTDVSVIHVRNLRVPVGGELRRSVHALLRSGRRRILLDLAKVSDIDAAGLGELVGAYNTTIAANGVLRIANASLKVRELLVRVGLFERLSASDESRVEEVAMSDRSSVASS